MNRRQDIPGASELDALETCGMTRELKRQYPEAVGRSALVGTAFHAAIAGMDAPSGLTDEEVERVAGWVAKTKAHYFAGAMDWCHEIPIGISEAGKWREYDSPQAIVCGTCDACVVEERDGERIVTVLDWKTGRAPILDDYYLQLGVYALALADRHACTRITMGIYAVQHGCWCTYPTFSIDSEFAGQLWGRIQAAATKPAVATVGPHCAECYQRGVCPHRLIPASSITALEPFTAPAGLTVDNLGKAQATVDAMADIVDRCKEAIRAFVMQQGGAVSLGNGKELALVECAGRESADIKALKEAGLGQYIKRGNDYKTLKIRKKQ